MNFFRLRGLRSLQARVLLLSAILLSLGCTGPVTEEREESRKDQPEASAEERGPESEVIGGLATDQPRRVEEPPAQVDAAQVPGIVAEFERRVSEYEKLRKKLDDGLPRLKGNETPEEIEVHRKLLAARIRGARAEVPVGAIFFPAAAHYFRQLIQSGSDWKDREFVAEGEKPRGVPLQVNHPYPDEAAYSSVPASLLQRFPVLPEDIQYRFANHNLILLDSRADIIIDFIPQKSAP